MNPNTDTMQTLGSVTIRNEEEVIYIMYNKNNNLLSTKRTAIDKIIKIFFILGNITRIALYATKYFPTFLYF